MGESDKERYAVAVASKPSLLPFDDPGSPRWYVSDHIRKLWITVGSAAAAIATLWGGSAAAGPIVAAFGVPAALVASYRAFYYRRSSRTPLHLPFPRSGTEGNQQITKILQRIYDEIHDGSDAVPSKVPSNARLRLTLFAPDPSLPLVLRQAARYSTHSCNVSAAMVRMGTGDVGLAFTNCRTIHVPRIRDLGPTFQGALRRLGIEELEALAHSEIGRQSFYSIPIIDENQKLRYGVLSLDAMNANFFNTHRNSVRHGVLHAHLSALLEKMIAAGFQGLPVPADAEVKDKITANSEDSVYRVLPRRPPTTADADV